MELSLSLLFVCVVIKHILLFKIKQNKQHKDKNHCLEACLNPDVLSATRAECCLQKINEAQNMAACVTPCVHYYLSHII